jgi:hypothetical protein
VPRTTILSASSGNGRWSALASSQGARVQASRSSSVVGITGIAFGWIGFTDQPSPPPVSPKLSRLDPSQERTARSRFKERISGLSLLPTGSQGRIAMLFFQEGFSYRNFLLDALSIFFLIVWFWLLITVASDLFRRHDISGWAKAAWVIGWIVLPYIAVLAYLIFQGKGMAERNQQQAQQARDEIRSAIGFSVADEIEKLTRLKQTGSISDAEFARLRTRLVQ